MSETPEQRVARLQHELDQAKIDDLQKQLAAAQAAAGVPVANVVDNAQIQQLLDQAKHGGAVSFAKPQYGAPAEGAPLAPAPSRASSASS